jgi:hypothetical protein
MSQLHLNFVARALTGIESLPPSERADHYDLAAQILTEAPSDPIVSAAAAAARTHANNLREAEMSQLHFRALMPILSA